MKRMIKGVLVLVAGLIAAVAAVFLVSSVLYTPTYMARYVWYNTSELTDWKIFPCNKVENRAPAFLFRKVAGQDRVRSLAKGVAYESHRSGMTEIGDLDAFLAGNATTAFIVIKDDAVIYEKYFNGYKRDTMLNCFSVSKSFTSALVGIALDEGLIKDIDDPITAYLPELKDKGHRDITIRHLLMMSSGMSYSAGDLWWQDDPINYYYADLRKLAIQRARIEEPPGRHHLYNNYHPQLLGMILERVTGGTVSHYLQEKIWKPLGMEFPAVWSLDSEEHRFEHMESLLNARPIDLARFGRLFLRKGDWNGRRVISEQYVSAATAPFPSPSKDYYSVFTEGAERRYFEEGGGYYKYFWWGYAKGKGGYDYFAVGHLGQYIYVNPGRNVIIVRTGTDRADVVWWPEILRKLSEKL
jgi:CubicO group peptidase (beta-lactamase class C family)